MDTDLIVDPPASGAWNMGFDEALRERVAQTGRAAVRFYQWAPATLSLGYFQCYASRGEHPGSAGLPVVRRASGGGAIVHDRELTYSCVFPVRDRLGRPIQQLVDEFHRALIEILRDWSIAARLCESASGISREEEPFLCFRRRAAGDVLLDGAKIAGQRPAAASGVGPAARQRVARPLAGRTRTARNRRLGGAAGRSPGTGAGLGRSPRITAGTAFRRWRRRRAAPRTNRLVAGRTLRLVALDPEAMNCVFIVLLTLRVMVERHD